MTFATIQTALRSRMDRLADLWHRAGVRGRSGMVLGSGLTALALWVASAPARDAPAGLVFPMTAVLAPESAPESPPKEPEPAASGNSASQPASAPPRHQAPAPPPPPPSSAASTARPASRTAALDPVPDLGLIEESTHGFLPRKGADGRVPADVYARPFQDATDRPRIAIVMRGIGIGAQIGEEAIVSLPPEISLSISPHAPGPQSWVNRARALGHEVLLDLPMEPFGYPDQDPGPHALLTRLPDAEQLARLHRHLARATGFIGCINVWGSAFLGSRPDMRSILADLSGRGLVFLDDGTADRSVTLALAQSLELRAAKADRAIGRQPSARRIDLALLELEALARTQGQAIGVAEASAIVLDRIKAWVPTIEGKGFVLAPVSAMMAPSRDSPGADHAALAP